MSTRPPIPDDLAAEVMFSSDRTCCVCRIERQKVQIHHIDEDPLNNTKDNLAVICLFCHSDAHTKGAFVRNLTPELIRLYNESWREIVAFRLMPRHDTGDRELSAEVFLEFSLIAHQWKNSFLQLGPEAALVGEASSEFKDVWDAMLERCIPSYSESAFLHFLPLYEKGLSEVCGGLERLAMMFPDAIPGAFRTKVLRTIRRLQVERYLYQRLPDLIQGSDPNDSLFRRRFTDVIRTLREFARSADQMRTETTSTSTSH